MWGNGRGAKCLAADLAAEGELLQVEEACRPLDIRQVARINLTLGEVLFPADQPPVKRLLMFAATT